jgi:arylsulfatase A-like enzyme
MNQHAMTVLMGAALLAPLSCGARVDDGGGGKHRPNVLLISVDMLRPDHLGCYGYERETSPHIDRLAREGVLFEECVSSAPWTLPAHAALFTGLPDSVHLCTDSDRALASEFTTLAERFRDGGYRTAGFFSGPYLHPAFGLDQGFDSYINCTSYARAIDEQPVEDWAMDREVMRSSHRDVTSPAVAEAVQTWLDGDGAAGDDPFFMFVHLWDVHFDFLPPAPFDAMFTGDYEGDVTGEDFFFDPAIRADMPDADREHLLALYDGEIRWTDWHIGLILAALEERGIMDKTVIVLTADHGTEFFEHGGKAHRMTLFDEVLRVPLILRYPPSIPAASRLGGVVRTVDIAPTLLELADLEPLTPSGGRSLLQSVVGGRPNDSQPVAAVSELFSAGRSMRSVRTERWKFVDDIGRNTYYWFDLQADPRELHPSQDLDHALGAEAEAGYREAVTELGRLFAASPAGPATSTVPADVAAHLRALGYVGNEGGED